MRWKLALAQHPMYLLIREDTQCAERTPPWGAPDIEQYIDRVRQNLRALERYPQLKLGYEWSGIELELLARDAPEVFAGLRAFARQGRVQFYNGTYAQPHLQTLSAESNLRQFEYGAEVYRAAGLPPVRTYAHQEASVHDQVPQLLGAFGYRFAVAPGFLSTLAWLEEGELLLHGVRGPRFVEGHEFVHWQGLDGTKLPLYLHQPAPRESTLKETLVRETILGRLNAPPLLVDLPDMVDVDEAWMAARQEVEFVLLDEALDERLRAAPPSARARLFTHWSYLEGIRAEELSRCNWQAERAALRAETLGALAGILVDRPAEPCGDLWRSILALQHHDVYCFSAPELRGKAIRRLRAVERLGRQRAKQAAGAIAAQIDTTGPANGCLVVFNTTPHPQAGLVCVEVPGRPPAVLDGLEHIPAEALPAGSDSTRLRFIADLPGFGYHTYWLEEGIESVPAQPVPVTETLVFENPFYRAAVEPDGTFASLVLKPGGDELLDRESGPGNRLSATDSVSISLRPGGPAADDPQARLERYLADPPVRGPALHWSIDGPASLLKSPLGVTLSALGRIGGQTEAAVCIQFYHRLPRIDLTWRFTFHQASLGTFFDDESKLLVRWPLGFAGQITHDIPFGAVRTRAGRPFFPVSWVDITAGGKGLAIIHSGTPHFWVSGNTLFNLIAWGEETDAIHNGLGRHQWLKAFDQRLAGAHEIRHALFAHNGDWRAADVAGAARCFRFPPMAVKTGPHHGPLPARHHLLAIKDPALEATSLFTRKDQVVCRVCAANGGTPSGELELNGLTLRGLQGLSGEALEKLRPFQIGEFILEK